MSTRDHYCITCYNNSSCDNNEGIERVSIRIDSVGSVYGVPYGQDLTVPEDIPAGEAAVFTAKLTDGYAFTRWVYRVGGTNNTAQYSIQNPFTYTGGTNGNQDIVIRAECVKMSTGDSDDGGDDSGGGNDSGDDGGSGDGTWSLTRFPTNSSTLLISSDYKSDEVEIEEYTMYRWRVSFAKSGVATFYTTGLADTEGYLSTSTNWDDEDGQLTKYEAYDDDGGADDNFSFSYDVKAGEIYYVWVRDILNDASSTMTLHITAPKANASPEKWDWEKSNGEATAAQTYAAYRAATNETEVTNFSYLVWNDLCDKVVEIIDAMGGSWYNNYATYANTKMSSADKELTAARFNSLRFNIGSRYSTGIDEVEPEDEVLGEYFITLAECINDWIDSL